MSWLSAAVQERLAYVLAHFVWQGFALAALLMLLVWLSGIKRPQVRYGLSLVTFLLMAACPIATWCLAPELTTAPPTFPVTANAIESRRTSARLENTGADASEFDPSTDIAWPEQQAPIAALPPELGPEDLGNVIRNTHITDVTSGEPTNTHWIQHVRPYEPLIIGGWLIGVGLLSLRLLFGAIGLWRWRRATEPVPDSLAPIVERLCQTMSMLQPSVRVCRRVSEAVALGLFKPMILLPTSWVTELPPDMLEAVLAHELAHIRRLDLWVNLFQGLVETLLFYHPAVWWLSRRLRIERELCCDEVAVTTTRDNLRYAEMLEYVGRMRVRRMPAALATSMTGPKHALLDRVRHVLQPRPTGIAWSGAFAVALVCSLLAVGGALGLLNQTSAFDDPNAEAGASTEASEKPSSLQAKFDGGPTLELLGIGTHQIKPEQWWAPNGARWTERPHDPSAKQLQAMTATNVQAQNECREILLRVSNLPEGDSFVAYQWLIDGHTDFAHRAVVRVPTELSAGFWPMHTPGKPAPKSMSLRVGLGEIPEKFVRTLNADAQKTDAAPRSDELRSIDALIQPVGVEESNGQIELILKRFDRASAPIVVDYVPVAFDKSGKKYEITSRGRRPDAISYLFPISKRQLDHFEFHFRRYRHQATFENVSLDISHPTEAKVVIKNLDQKESVKATAQQRAIEFLKQQQQADGTWPPKDGVHGGPTALTLCALLQAGVPAEDAAIQKGIQSLTAIEPQSTYVVSLQTIALCLADPVKHADLIRRNVTWLEKAQSPTKGGWRYTEQAGDDGDGSNTRFAVWALHQAAQSGFAVRLQTWSGIQTYWTASRQQDGGWGYHAAAVSSTPTMTCAGLAGLATVLFRTDSMPPDKVASDEAIQGGLKWLTQRDGRLLPTQKATWFFYHSQLLSQTCQLLKVDRLGNRDWRSELTALLLKQQQADGSFVVDPKTESRVIATSFALMALPVEKDSATAQAAAANDTKQPAPVVWGPAINGLRARVVPVSAQMNEEAVDLVHAEPTFDVLDDVGLAIEIENVSDKPVALRDLRYGKNYGESSGKLAADWFGQFLFSIDYYDAAGKMIERPELIPTGKGSGISDDALKSTLEPKQTIKMLLRPNRWISALSQQPLIGKQRAVVKYRGAVDDKAVEIVTPAVEFTVQKRGYRPSGAPAAQLGDDPKADPQLEPDITKQLIWGEPVNGLRAALDVVPEGRLKALSHGSKPKLKLVVQNVSDKPVSLASEMWLSELPIKVTDTKGETNDLPATWYTGITPVVRVMLKPQQVVTFDAGNVGLAVSKERAGKFEHVTHRRLIGPQGKYSLTATERFGTSFQLKDGEGNVVVPQEGDFTGDVTTGAARLDVTNEVIESEIVDAVTGKPVDGTTVSFLFIKPKTATSEESTVAHSVWGPKVPSRIYFTIPEVPEDIAQRADRDELEVRFGVGGHDDYEPYSPTERIPLKQFFHDGPEQAKKVLSKIKLTPKKKTAAMSVGPKPEVGIGQRHDRLVWSHDSQHLLANGSFNKLARWERKDGRWSATVVERSGTANSIAVSRTSPLMVLGTNLGTVEVWDSVPLAKKSLIKIGPEHSIYAVAISPDEKWIATCGTDGTVLLYDRATSQRRAVLGTRAETRMASLAFAPDGKSLAALDRFGQLNLWSIPDGARLADWRVAYSNENSVIQWSPDGKQIAATSWGRVTFIDPMKGSTPRLVKAPDAVRPKHPEDNSLITDYIGGPDGEKFLGDCALAPDFRTAASVAPDASLAIWEVASGRIIRTLPAPPAQVVVSDSWGNGFHHLTYSPNGQRLACSTTRGDVIFWQLTPNEVAPVTAETTRSQALPGNASSEAPPQVLSATASQIDDAEAAKTKTKTEAEPRQARPQAEPGNEKTPLPAPATADDREVLQRLIRGGKIDSKTIQLWVTQVARAGARDDEFARLVLAEFEKASAAEPGTNRLNRVLLSVIAELFEAWSEPRWKAQLAGRPANALPEVETEFLKSLIKHAYSADRGNIAEFTLAARMLHHSASREFLRDVLRNTESRAATDPFAPAPPSGTSPTVTPAVPPAATPTFPQTAPQKNAPTPKSKWQDDVGGSWSDAKFVAAVGLAELNEAEGVEWLLSAARDNDFGLDGSLFYNRHARDPRGSLRASSRLALSDLFGLNDAKSEPSFEPLNARWQELKPKFVARPVPLMLWMNRPQKVLGQVADPDRDQAPHPKAGALTADVPNGVRLELVGLSTIHTGPSKPDQRQWWDAQGSVIGSTEALLDEKRRLRGMSEYSQGREAIVRLTVHRDSPFVEALRKRAAWIEGEVDGVSSTPAVFAGATAPLLFHLAPNGPVQDDDRMELQLHTHFVPNADAKTARLRFGFGHEATSRTYDDKGKLNHETSVKEHPEIWRRFGFLRMESRPEGTVVWTKPTRELGDLGKGSVRLLLVDGTVIGSVSPQLSERSDEEQHVFSKVDIKDVEGVTLNVRTVTHWVAFSGLPLNAEPTSDSKVEVQTVTHNGLEFLKPYPKLQALSLDMTEPQFLEIVKQQALKATKNGDGDKTAYRIGLGDGLTLVVMFRADGSCRGIQRIRGEKDEVAGTARSQAKAGDEKKPQGQESRALFQ